MMRLPYLVFTLLECFLAGMAVWMVLLWLRFRRTS